MTIDHHAGEIGLTCDDCGEPHTATSAQDRVILLADAKADGWRTYKVGERWHHACPACVAVWAAEMNGGRLL